LASVEVKSGLSDGTIDGGIGDFLRRIGLTTPWISGRVIVGEIIVVCLDGADNVSLHDLHVIDVVCRQMAFAKGNLDGLGIHDFSTLA
jgi:hypothetical protein